MPTLVVYFYRNMMAISPAGVKRTMSAVLDCLADENVEVREMASKALSGIVRSSQRQSVVPLKVGVACLWLRVIAPNQNSADPPHPEPLHHPRQSDRPALAAGPWVRGRAAQAALGNFGPVCANTERAVYCRAVDAAFDGW